MKKKNNLMKCKMSFQKLTNNLILFWPKHNQIELLCKKLKPKVIYACRINSKRN